MPKPSIADTSGSAARFPVGRDFTTRGDFATRCDFTTRGDFATRCDPSSG